MSKSRVTESLTTESLARFVGGEAEIQNSVEDYVYRGEIAEIKVDGGELVVRFAWNAKNRGGPSSGLNPEWDNEPDLDYAISLAIYPHSDIGNGRMALSSHIMNELTTLFPADGSKLNPERVSGFPPHLMLARMKKWQAWDASR